MKRFTFLTIGSLVVGAMILLSSCAKDGAAGPAGAAGAAGPAGPTGPTGASGVSKVYYSTWKTYTFTGVDASSPADGVIDYYRTIINEAKIDAAIINNGEIKVYVNLGTTAAPDIAPLPFQDLLNPFFQIGKIEIDASASINPTAVNQIQFRYVIIPGSESVGLKAKGINLDNYKAVSNALQIAN